VTTCIPNIGPLQRRRRLVVGIVMFAIAVIVAGGLVLAGAPRAWRLFVLFPAWVGSIGLFQVKEQTCVALAARGLRNLDTGDEPIVDAIELQHVRAQSRKVHLQSAAFAIAITIVVLLLPA
jgi:hypothetical protein